jgi:uncharacterized protein (DUF1499 family)
MVTNKKCAMNKIITIVLISFIFLMGCSGTIPKLALISGQLMPCPEKPNCVSSNVKDKEHFIAPMNFTGTRQDAQELMLQILKSLKQTKIVVVEENYIRVEFTSKIFRFIDDVEFYFSSTKTEKTLIDFRSASRIGHSDLGANRKRIEQIRNKFNDL